MPFQGNVPVWFLYRVSQGLQFFLIVTLEEGFSSQFSVDPGFAIAKHNSPGANQSGSFGVDPVFDSLDSCLKLVRRLARLNAQTALQDTRAAVEFFRDEMDGAAVPFVARIDDSLMRIQAGVFGQKRRVNVEHAAFVMVYEGWTKDAHEPGQDDQFRLVLVELGNDRSVEGLAIRVIAMPNTCGRNTGFFGALEAVCVGSVAEDDPQVQIQIV